MQFAPLLDRILSDAKKADPKTVVETLQAWSKRDPRDCDLPTARLAWLLLCREVVGTDAGLVMMVMALETLDSRELDEFFEDRRVFNQLQQDYLTGRELPMPFVRSANFHESILEASLSDLKALTMIPLAEFRGEDSVIPEGADPRVISWLLDPDFEPETPEEQRRLAFSLVADGERDEALDLIEDLLADDEEDFRLLRMRGTLLLEDEDNEEALGDLRRCAEHDSTDANLCHDVALALVRLGRSEEALPWLAQAIEADAEHAGAHHMRGSIFDSLERADAALADLDRAIELVPDRALYRVTRARHHLSAGRNAQAKSDLSAALEEDPEHPGALRDRANLLEQEGDLDAAIEDLSVLVRVDDGPEARLLRGQTYLKKGQQQSALADFSLGIKALRHPQLCAARAPIYEKLGETDRAISDWVSVLAVSPEATKWTEMALKRLPELRYRHAIKYPLPENPELLVQQGVVLEQSGENDASIQAYRRAIELDPCHIDGLYNLGSLLLNTGDLDGALSVLDRTLSVAPNDAQALLNRGTAKLQAVMGGGPDSLVTEASDDFQQAIAADPKRPGGYSKLGMMEMLQGRNWNAIGLLSAAHSLSEEGSPQADALEDQIAGVTEGLASADPSEAHPSIDPILRTLLSTGCLQAALDLSRRLLRSLLPDDVGLMAHAAAAFWFADQDDTAEGEIETAWQIDPAGTSAAMQMLVESGVVSEKFLDLAPA